MPAKLQLSLPAYGFSLTCVSGRLARRRSESDPWHPFSCVLNELTAPVHARGLKGSQDCEVSGLYLCAEMSEDAKPASTESADSAPSPSSSRNVVTAAPVERDSFSDIGSAASSPTLRNAATAAPGEKVASLESADESVRAYDEDEIAHTVPCSCFAWSRERVRLCLCGSASAAIVLVVRLLLDWYSGTTYVIHSFIVFFDMCLIHLRPLPRRRGGRDVYVLPRSDLRRLDSS